MFNAWAVRRIGSAYSDVIELMSPEKMRTEHGLENGTKLKIKLFSGNK
jgi:CTP-dependent riboflavin kinase